LILFLATMLAAAAPAPAGSPTVPKQACGPASTANGLICRAMQAQTNGDSAGAAQGFEDAAKASVATDPKVARLWAAAGNAWIEADQPAKAATALDRALAAPGLEGAQRGETLLDRARAAEALGDIRTARARLDEAGATISADPFYWYFDAALAIREGDQARAQTAIAKALALAPSDATILFEAGHAADLAGNDDQARSYWTRAVDSDPNGDVGKAAAKAIEMLGVTPTVQTEGQPPK
jgi:tetratricopeptide (TPR) repeat protein